MNSVKTIPCDVAIIGAGMAGMAAALYAANRGLNTVVMGVTNGATTFASGLLDLLGVYPVEQKKKRSDPWTGIAELIKEQPSHPYALVSQDSIKQAFSELIESLQLEGLEYCGDSEKNLEVVTSLGTSKPSYRIPRSMMAGVQALREKHPCLFVDFHGMKEYSARQIISVLSKKWPNLRSARIDFSDSQTAGELYNTTMADALESEAIRDTIAETVRKIKRADEVVGFPAVLGLRGAKTVFEDLQSRVGSRIFEISTLPPSVPGLRLKEALESRLLKTGVRSLPFFYVSKARETGDGGFELSTEGAQRNSVVRSRCVILATGRFLGKGLLAERQVIREPVFNLPVHQPEGRKNWHREHFFDLRGHEVNRSGVMVDHLFRPVREKETPVFQTLFAAGSLLAHQDWVRTKSGAGLAIATAYQAVNACRDALGK